MSGKVLFPQIVYAAQRCRDTTMLGQAYLSYGDAVVRFDTEGQWILRELLSLSGYYKNCRSVSIQDADSDSRKISLTQEV
jgi:hypothetical protein